jgi:DNA-directed RNA polymerase beta' subunit
MAEIKLLDIELFIGKNNCLEVKNAKLPSEKTGYDPLSLYSELIFGSYGSQERKTRFGYINLNCKIIHPIVYDMVKTISEETSRIIYRKRKYIIKNNQFVENAAGETGLSFLIENFANVDFTKFCKKEKIDAARFIEKYKKIIIINKWLVIPAGYRDINYRDKTSIKIISKINEFYKDLLFVISQLSGEKDFDEIFIERIQYKTYQITDWFKKEKLAGKSGMFRGTMMKKRMDFTSRLVLLSSPELEMGEIGIPWHTAMAIFEPIFSYNLFKKNVQVLEDIKQYLETNDFGQDDFDKFVRDIISNPDSIPDSLKEQLIPIAKEIVKDQIVIVKRDPVTDRNSYFAAVPKITPGRVAYVNSLQLKPLGGDTFKGKVVVYDKDFRVSVVDVSDFPNQYKLKFLSNTDDRWIYELQDEIYSLSINPITGKIDYNLIKYWHVHTDVQFYKLSIPDEFDNVIVGARQSIFVLNLLNNKYEKIDISELENNKTNYSFIDKEYKLIPASSIIIERYCESDYNNIELEGLPINLNPTSTGYDLTIDNDQKNFLHSEGIFICNSDGDTISIVPLFSEEAKQEAREKMLAGTAPKKFNSLSNYGKTIYSLWLDTIATIYKITKDPDE